MYNPPNPTGNLENIYRRSIVLYSTDQKCQNKKETVWLESGGYQRGY